MADIPQPPAKARRLFGPWTGLRAADVQLHRLADDLSGALICLMIVFSPWAFGTTQTWSIWTMNLAGYALGALLLAKLFFRQLKGLRPPRWETCSEHSGWTSRRRDPLVRLLKRALAALTLAILGFCLVSALNPAATYNPQTRLFAYHPHLTWLPHSLDSRSTWFAFWMYLGLAASFWAIHDWLMGMTMGEERALHRQDPDLRPSPVLPRRLRLVLWLLCLNGAVLGVEAIVQRASGSNQLLFFMPTHTNKEALDQFGPYAYRSNAAQYFNLLWPLCLGFWWTLHRLGGRRWGAHHLLLLCAAILAACPVISASRGGALVAMAMVMLAVLLLTITSLFARARGTALALSAFVVLAAVLAAYFGWIALEPRLEQLSEGFQNREAMYQAAEPMAADYPLFGTGPGTFGTVFRLYLFSSATYWPEQLHNDWLETRITFGWLGLALILAALACVLWRWFAPGGIRGGRRFVMLTWLALAGCLIEARFDFPFQVYSVIFLFLLMCAMLLSMGRRRA